MTNSEPCGCPCGCAAPGQRDDDDTPGWCDSCRMGIHQEKFRGGFPPATGEASQ